MRIITLEQAANILVNFYNIEQNYVESNGGAYNKFFYVKFIKRTTGEVREMLCRFGVKSHLRGGERAYNPIEKGLVFVFDCQKMAYRSINLDAIQELHIDGEKYEIKGINL